MQKLYLEGKDSDMRIYCMLFYLLVAVTRLNVPKISLICGLEFHFFRIHTQNSQMHMQIVKFSFLDLAM